METVKETRLPSALVYTYRGENGTLHTVLRRDDPADRRPATPAERRALLDHHRNARDAATDPG